MVTGRSRVGRKKSVLSKSNFINSVKYLEAIIQLLFVYPVSGKLVRYGGQFLSLYLFHRSVSASRVAAVGTRSHLSIWPPNR